MALAALDSALCAGMTELGTAFCQAHLVGGLGFATSSTFFCEILGKKKAMDGGFGVSNMRGWCS